MKEYIGLNGYKNILHILEDYSENFDINLDNDLNLIFKNKVTGEEILIVNYDVLFFEKDINKTGNITNGYLNVNEKKLEITKFYSQSGIVDIPSTYETDNDGYYVFNFSEPFATTPLIFSIANDYGENAARVNIKEIDNDNVVINIIESPSFDGPHANQTTSFFGILPGIYKLGDITFECGYIETKKVVGNYADSNNEFGWETITLKNSFENLGVILMPQTKNNENNNIPYEVANPWFSVACNILSDNSFEIALDLGETNGLVEVPEKIAYVAFSTGKQSSFVDSNGNTILIETFKLDGVKGWDDGWFAYNFANNYSSAPQIIVASTNSRNDSRGGWVRYNRTYDENSVSFTIDCDTAQRNDRNHDAETIAGIIISAPYIMKIN